MCGFTARDLGYEPGRFRGMLIEAKMNRRTAVQVAKGLLSSGTIQSGFERLWEMKRLDLTVEAHVLLDRFWDLFTNDERREAQNRLLENDSRFFEARRDTYFRYWQWVDRRPNDV